MTWEVLRPARPLVLGWVALALLIGGAVSVAAQGSIDPNADNDGDGSLNHMDPDDDNDGV